MTGSAVTTVRPPKPPHLPSHHEALEPSRTSHGFVLTTASKSFEEEDTSLTDTADNMHDEQPVVRRPRSGSEGLDFLAALAERERDALLAEAAATTEMPPPRPRRPRSVSNPEDMMRLEATSSSNARCPLVLPPSILEEELAEATVAVQEACTQDPETLLTNARTRLLEEVSEQCTEKGEIILPHTLSKYKEIYNSHGRIGVYTKAERAAILARFHNKRMRRNWRKKIRYNCRKSLADSRLRVKGRFIKRSEQEQMELLMHHKEETDVTPVDDDMPDVNDPEAGFCPTEDQPYRRLRRHTVT